MQDTPDLQKSSISTKSLGIGKAIIIGHVLVNAPVIFIMLIFSCSGFFFAFSLINISGDTIKNVFVSPVFIIPSIIGIIVAWLWWSFSVPRWREWALKNGAPDDELQKWGVITGLVWPKGSLFEKTEFKQKE